MECVKIGKKELYLYCNGAAAIKISDMEAEYGAAHPDDERNIISLLCGRDMACMELLCKAAAVLATQGELARRYLGYDKGPLLEADDLIVLATHGVLAAIREAAIKAIVSGYSTGADDGDDEYDPLLAKIEKKTEPQG